MKVFCIHCGQPIEIKDGQFTKQARCLACGKTTLVPGGGGTQGSPPDSPAESRPAAKTPTKDLVILVLALLVVALLAWLLFRPESGARRLVFGDLGAKPPAQKEGETVPAERGLAGLDAASPASGSPGYQTGESPAGGVAGGAVAGQTGPGARPVEGKAIPLETADNAGLKKEDDTQPEAVTPNGGSTSAGTADGKSPVPAGGGGVIPNTAGRDNAKLGVSAISQLTQPARVTGNALPQTSPASAEAIPANSREPAPATSPTPNPATPPPRANAALSTPSSPLTGVDRPVAPAIPSEPVAPPLQVAKETTSALLGDAAPPTTADTKSSSPSAPAKNSPSEPGAGEKGQTSPPTSGASTPGDPTNAGGGGGGKLDKKEEPPQPEPNAFDPLRGTNVMFVLDRSLSMRGDKSVRARHELVDTLNQLGPDKTFYVMFFPYEPMPAAGPLLATRENIRSITNWLFSLDHAFGSDPTKSVERGLAFKPDTVWLLSDGAFSSKVSEAIRAANASTKARIHTVGLYDRGGEKTMRQISGENGGTYRFVPPPATGAKATVGAAPK